MARNSRVVWKDSPHFSRSQRLRERGIDKSLIWKSEPVVAKFDFGIVTATLGRRARRFNQESIEPRTTNTAISAVTYGPRTHVDTSTAGASGRRLCPSLAPLASQYLRSYQITIISVIYVYMPTARRPN